jgi:hypothetical protein
MGVPRDTALRAVTLTAAEAIGLGEDQGVDRNRQGRRPPDPFRTIRFPDVRGWTSA